MNLVNIQVEIYNIIDQTINVYFKLKNKLCRLFNLRAKQCDDIHKIEPTEVDVIEKIVFFKNRQTETVHYAVF